jgi:hypothetical protein
MVRTPFAALAEAFEKLEATTSGLKMIDILADLLGYFDNQDHQYELPRFAPCLAANSGLKLSDRQVRRIMGGLRDGRTAGVWQIFRAPVASPWAGGGPPASSV